VHDGVRGDIEDFDAMMLAGTLNRDFVVPFVMFNHGPRLAYPKIRIGRPDEVDVAIEISSAEKLAAMGVQIDGEEMRERAGLPAAKSPETALRPKQAAQSPQNAENEPEGPPTPEKSRAGVLDPLKSASGGNRSDQPAINSQGNPDGDAIDAAIDELLDDWQPQIDPLLAPVDALIAEATDLSEVQARLSQLIGDMDTSAFEQLLAQGGFAARMVGEAEREGGEA